MAKVLNDDQPSFCENELHVLPGSKGLRGSAQHAVLVETSVDTKFYTEQGNQMNARAMALAPRWRGWESG